MAKQQLNFLKMLQAIIDRLCQNRVVLASQSPRRKELMELMVRVIYISRLEIIIKQWGSTAQFKRHDKYDFFGVF